MKIKSLTIFLLILVVFEGCGYKPTSSVAKKSISGAVFVDVKMNIQNLNNSILIKDSIINMLISKFDVNIVTNRSLAKSIIYGELKSVSETILETKDGYATKYRETVTIFISYIGNDQKIKNITVSNYYDFIVSDDSVVSQNKKDEAIMLAINKALTDIFSKIAINSL